MTMEHRVKSPFPFKLPTGIAIDEKCYCGHLRSQHADTLSYGHGPCEALTKPNGHRCHCPKYTWEDFVLQSKKKK